VVAYKSSVKGVSDVLRISSSGLICFVIVRFLTVTFCFVMMLPVSASRQWMYLFGLAKRMDLCVPSVYSSTRWNDVCLQH